MLAKLLIKKLIDLAADAQTFWIAYSGGLDSHVLLHLIATSSDQLLPINAVHINHGLSPFADAWQVHCQQVCDALAIPLQTFAVDAQPQPGESPEAAARLARYQQFSQLLASVNDYMLTAHHQDDQAETLLLQLFRGAGIKGLAAMPSKMTLGTGQLVRPLLDVSRAELVEYAKQHKLDWIEDESNSNHCFERNYLRHEVLPLVAAHWPGFAKVVSRSAQHCAEAAELVDDLAAQDLALAETEAADVLNVQSLLTLSLARQRNLLRYWITAILDMLAPSAAFLQQLQQQLLASAFDANPKLVWQSIEFRRYRHKIYALKSATSFPIEPIKWDIRQPLLLPQQLGSLECQFKAGQGISSVVLSQPVQVSFRQGGERCHPMGRQGSHPLKKLFQKWQIPPWQRDKIPLIYQADKLIAVVGYCICEPYAAKANELGGQIKLI